jgi:hypothetical protein
LKVDLIVCFMCPLCDCDGVRCSVFGVWCERVRGGKKECGAVGRECGDGGRKEVWPGWKRVKTLEMTRGFGMLQVCERLLGGWW